ncbi:MAG TPA: hypothetical protein V6C89_09225 [Drouetiella sp.]|jgi:hypothetical protein
MFRSFCVGALMGFVFGSSKKGHEVRETIDGMLTELTSSDAMKALDGKKNELSEIACDTLTKITSKFSDQEEDAERNGSDSKRNGAESKEKNGDLRKSANKAKGAGDSKDDEGRSAKNADKSEARTAENAESAKDKASESEEQSFEPQENSGEDIVDVTATPAALDADKAQELADKLGAKPSTPEDENLAAFSHHEDDLKSA